MQHVDKCTAIAAHYHLLRATSSSQISSLRCCSWLYILLGSLARLAWPFEKQNAPCLPTSLPYSDLADGWPRGRNGWKCTAQMGTHTPLRSLAPCIKRAIYFSSSSAAPPTLSCQIKFIGGTTPTTKRRVWRGEAELKKVTKNEEIVESARDHREVLEYFIATPREFRPRSIVFCFVPHSPNPSSSARMCAGEGRTRGRRSHRRLPQQNSLPRVLQYLVEVLHQRVVAIADSLKSLRVTFRLRIYLAKAFPLSSAAQ